MNEMDCQHCGETLKCNLCGGAQKGNSRSINPDQMRYGKRYRVIFDGVADVSQVSVDEDEVNLIGMVDWNGDGKAVETRMLDFCDLEIATRIEPME